MSVAFASWAARPGPAATGARQGYALALGAIGVIMTGQDAFTVLFGWESLTVAFYLLAGSSGTAGTAGAARSRWRSGR